MDSHVFRFKRFSVCQDRCPMKVGTDGVLLGAWALVPPGVHRILDIGTGTGLIALMLAQRTEGIDTQITGIDVDEVCQARENADASPWGARVCMVRCPVQEFFPAHRFEWIVSNPPFFVDSLTSPDAGRTLARHARTLPYEELCGAVGRLLAPGGRFALILPTVEAARFLEVSRGRLVLCRRTDVRTTPRRAPKRALMEFVRAGEECALGRDAAPAAPPERTELVIGTGRHEQYTEAYRALTRDFYLKF